MFKKQNKIEGWYELIKSLFSRQYKNKVAFYYRNLSPLFVNSGSDLSYLLICLSNPCLLNLCKAGVYLIKLKKYGWYRSFFMPFFAYRDCGVSI